MKTTCIKRLATLAAMCAGLPLLADTATRTNTPENFAFAVPFELGDSEFTPGDSITIQELRGTTGDIRPGGTYCVTGTYTLNSQDEADLSFFATTTNTAPTPIDPQQTMHVTKGTGSFRLIKQMTDEGYLHLTFYPRRSGSRIGGVYFGQGQWVLHDKHFGIRDFVSSAKEPDVHEHVSFTGPNQALFDYLGNPVAPPADIAASYTKEGLTAAIQAAAQNAGITLKKLEIEDSEFPFLVGVICASKGDMEKLKVEIRKLPAYHYGGDVGGGDSSAMNIVPPGKFPEGTFQRIYHRMMLREALFYDKITGAQ